MKFKQFNKVIMNAMKAIRLILAIRKILDYL